MYKDSLMQAVATCTGLTPHHSPERPEDSKMSSNMPPITVATSRVEKGSLGLNNIMLLGWWSVTHPRGDGQGAEIWFSTAKENPLKTAHEPYKCLHVPCCHGGALFSITPVPFPDVPAATTLPRLQDRHRFPRSKEISSAETEGVQEDAQEDGQSSFGIQGWDLQQGGVNKGLEDSSSEKAI